MDGGTGDVDNVQLRELGTVVEELLAERGDPPDQQGYDHSLWNDLVHNGFAHVGIPESAGGSGGGPLEAAVVLRAVGRQAAAVPLADAVLAGWLLAACGRDIPDGLAVFANGELTTVDDGDGTRVTGRLVRVAGGRDCHTVIAFAETGRVGSEVVVAIPMEACSIITGRNLAGEPRDDLIVDTVLSPSAVSPAPSGAVAELRLRGALSRAVLSAGAMAGLVDTTVRYVLERQQFGRPLAAFQSVQQSVALLAAEAAAAQAAADAAVRIGVEHGFSSPTAKFAIAAAKVRTAEAATAGAAAAHQLHGAIGMTLEHPLRRLTARLWSWRTEWGGQQEWAEYLGRTATVAGGVGLWAALTDA
ncbi:acyl-CoA dehydrogenase family protein [Mycolicibacterium elephantis]|uniref:Acyl-CoA dehydrogenase n=1 Tax=Mycolicibacterium elephantis DSM 44368 TaxID=1335622 RepID=A0A439DSW7_9MYCO|nr:acyl-CoA dehydrogenase family protein [Mycolicibacterium elephantis]MCV7222107.1 acyl-CoA dehydrogenase family protein [Mycolicibacterium elephantis]RWA19463.1 hypothetical protein MELE44368_20595 [Mycolicibacterium elephantis DSM 44368]